MNSRPSRPRRSRDRADVGVVQRRRRLRLVQEPLLGLRVPGQLRRQELQGHGALQGGVLGPVHHAHPARAELRQDPVVGDVLPIMALP